MLDAAQICEQIDSIQTAEYADYKKAVGVN